MAKKQSQRNSAVLVSGGLDGTEVQTSLTSSESSITLSRQQLGWIRKTGLPHSWFESPQVGLSGW